MTEHVQHVHANGCHRALRGGALVNISTVADYCNACSDPWPCDTALAAERERQRLRDEFLALRPPAVVARLAVWRLLGGSDLDLPRSDAE
jgi:hypothetical protein